MQLDSCIPTKLFLSALRPSPIRHHLLRPATQRLATPARSTLVSRLEFSTTMAIRARSPSPSTSAPPTKRPKLSSTPDYGAGLHLAPMVRIGTCPTRLIALENGANLVWGPEIVDKAIIGATREVDRTSIPPFRPPSTFSGENAFADHSRYSARLDSWNTVRTGTIKYMKKGRSIFECHPIEKPYLIFQLGSADPKLAVEAALLVAQDVAGVGLNCGCPKPFSLSGGMGAALLRTPDKICEVGRFALQHCVY